MSRRIAVSGSASGIGAALSARLRAEGAEVIGIDVRDADVVADLGQPDGRAEAVARVVELCNGRLDGLVTCAGLSTPGVPMVAVNFFGTTALVDGLRPALAAAGGKVALVGSISGTQPLDDELVEALLVDDETAARHRAQALLDDGAAQRIYPSTKSGIARWARRTAVAPGWADAGIPINVVAPGVVLTPMVRPLMNDPKMRTVMDEAVPMPLGGHLEPESVARVLAWLIEPDLLGVTGQVIYVDGGAETVLRGPDVY